MMKVRIYDSSDLLEERSFDVAPAIGDQIDLIIEGKPVQYKVSRVYRHFDTENKASDCISVTYDGPPSYMF